MNPPTDPRIDAYIAEAEPFAQPILRHIRKLVHAACPTVEEAIKWSHACFVLDGKILFMVGAFKAHCTFGFWHKDAQALIARELGNSDEAGGMMGRLTTLADLPSDAAMRRYLKLAASLAVSGKPARAKAKPRPPAAVPADLAAALKKNRAAAKTFESFSPSHRRDYIEWITEAKRPETRQTRLATTLEWLAEGKARNWKYVNC